MVIEIKFGVVLIDQNVHESLSCVIDYELSESEIKDQVDNGEVRMRTYDSGTF